MGGWKTMDLSASWENASGIRRFDNMLKQLPTAKQKLVQVRALKRAGNMARTQVVRALAKQTGLKQKIIRKAIGKPKPPNFDSLTYVMATRGGEVSLKYFRARESRKGVTAYPFGKRTLFAGAFMKGGRFPNRKFVSKFHGGVFEADSSSSEWGRAFKPVRSNVWIPNEMVSGETARAFTQTVAIQLPRRVEHELSRMTRGVLS